MRAWIAIGCVFVGCHSTEMLSEYEQIEIKLVDLSTGTPTDHAPTMPILVGSESRLTDWVTAAPYHCFEPRLENIEGREWLHFAEAGSASVVFEPTGCEELPDARSDRLDLTVIEASEVSARFAWYDIEWALKQLDEGRAELGDGESLPPPLVPLPGEPLRVVAGVPTPIEVAFTSGGEPVLVGPGAGFLEATEGGVITPTRPLRATFVAPDVGAGELRFVTPEGDIFVGEYEAIPAREVRRVHSAMAIPTEELPPEFHAGVVFWAEDREGNVIHRLPLDFEVVEGPSAPPRVEAGNLWWAYPACTPPWELEGQILTRTMQASFGNRRTRREVTLDLTDFRLEPEELERARAEWERPEACVPGTRDARSGSGCGCTSTQAPTGLALLFALLPWLRRRRAV